MYKEVILGKVYTARPLKSSSLTLRAVFQDESLSESVSASPRLSCPCISPKSRLPNTEVV